MVKNQSKQKKKTKGGSITFGVGIQVVKTRQTLQETATKKMPATSI